jgi:hypothetical protein
MTSKFYAALSEKSITEEAVKDLSIKIKTQSGSSIKYLLIFFTSHHNPVTLKDNIYRTINPKTLWGMQAPMLILDEKTTNKGILAIAINGENVNLKEISPKNDTWEAVEGAFRRELRDIPGEKAFIFGSLPAGINFHNYIRGINMSVGKNAPAIYAGFMKKYAFKNYIILNNHIEEGSLTIAGKGIHTDCLRLGGYVPLGKPFTITRSMPDHGLIMEINNKPAVEMYKHYFEDKFETLKKRRFFPFYPLTIRDNNKKRMLSVLDVLEDGSMACLGSVKEGLQANFSILHQPSLLASIKRSVEPITKNGEGFIFMINSLLRKRILMDSYTEEIKAVKNAVGEKFKVAGIYSDYAIFPEKQQAELGMETGNLLLTLWK